MQNGERTLRILARPFQKYLHLDPGVTDIIMNRPCEVAIESRGIWSWHHEPALTFDRLDAMAILAGALMGKDIDETCPILDTHIPMQIDASDEPTKCRLAICRPNATEPGNVVLALRRPPAQARSVRDDDFRPLFATTNQPGTHRRQADQHLLHLYRNSRFDEFLPAAVQARRTVGGVGRTGSGKTDLLRRLLAEIPEHERIVTGEDTPEFGKLRQRNRAALFWGSPAVTPGDIATAFLRLRPDRPVMQEVRGAESYEFLETIANGHPGGMTTWHSESGDPFDSLLLKIKKNPHATGVPDDKIRAMLKEYIHVVFTADKVDGVFAVTNIWFRDAEEADREAA